MRKIIILRENKKIKSFVDFCFFIIKIKFLCQKTQTNNMFFFVLFLQRKFKIMFFCVCPVKNNTKQWNNTGKCPQMMFSINSICFPSNSNRFCAIFISFSFLACFSDLILHHFLWILTKRMQQKRKKKKTKISQILI